ncbi:Uncharacterised protein [Vibrio cholerae]|uniref:Uncharacterized protein n=1 Tax=Vibrio cholerae TaxID=666 RepID=A0A655P9F2_VIBCL|nr:Uncharacterised protein [Vibrio cholerae]
MTTECTKTAVGIAIKQNRAIDDVFKNFRSRQRTIFGYVAHNKYRHIILFSITRKRRGRLTHLRDTPR